DKLISWKSNTRDAVVRSSSFPQKKIATCVARNASLFPVDQPDVADVVTGILRRSRAAIRVADQFALDGDDVAGPEVRQPGIVFEPDLAAKSVLLRRRAEPQLQMAVIMPVQ